MSLPATTLLHTFFKGIKKTSTVSLLLFNNIYTANSLTTLSRGSNSDNGNNGM